MSELSEMYTRQRKYIFLLMAAYVLGWGFTPYQSIFLGLILGTSISLFNLWLLFKKTHKFGEMAIKGKKMRSLGFLYRIAAALAAVMVAMELPQYFHLISVIIGLMTSYIVIMIDSFLQMFHSYK